MWLPLYLHLGISIFYFPRFLGFDILTIREAAWLTDNSYSYHDVVKMMGELVAAVKGNIRVRNLVLVLSDNIIINSLKI